MDNAVMKENFSLVSRVAENVSLFPSFENFIRQNLKLITKLTTEITIDPNLLSCLYHPINFLSFFSIAQLKPNDTMLNPTYTITIKRVAK